MPNNKTAVRNPSADERIWVSEMTSNSDMTRPGNGVAYYHLPGLFEFHELYRLFLPLFREHREYFYDWCDIGSIYGAPEGCMGSSSFLKRQRFLSIRALAAARISGVER